MNSTSSRYQVSIEADPTVPIIRMTRDFDATPAQLMRAHTDPDLFARESSKSSACSRWTSSGSRR